MGFPYPYPLGLPRGTVRASITLLFSSALVYLIWIDSPVAPKLGTSVAVAVAFYFGGRVRGTMTAGEASSPGERAFGLPAKTVRSILTLMFVGLWVYLYVLGRVIPAFLSEFVLMILGFIVGAVFFWFKHVFFGKATGKKVSPMWFEHLKALVVLGISGFIIYGVLAGLLSASDTWAFKLAYITIGFYFGERR